MKHLLITSIAAVLLVGCKSMQTSGLSDLTVIKTRLVQPLKFDGLTVSNLDQVRNINNLFHERISMGGQDGFVFLRLNLDDDESYVRTETVAQYLARLRQGAGPYTTYDLSMDSWFVNTASTLSFLRSSKPSKSSLLGDDLIDLSVSFLPWVGSEERASLEADAKKGMTLGDYSKQGKIKKVKKTPGSISFEINDQYKIIIDEWARGDYNSDGYEDSLITKAKYYIGGSGRIYYPYIVQRTDTSRVCMIEDYVYIFRTHE